MFCPETIIICNKWVSICHNGIGDVRWEYRSWKERFNPLRYSVFLIRQRRGYLIRINRNGRLEIMRSNFVWKYLGGKRRAEKRWAMEREREEAEFQAQLKSRQLDQ